MPTLKSGEKITWKELGSRWKLGMQKVTPLQQCLITQWAQIVSGAGVIWGIVFSIRLAYWWMMVILIGGLILVGVQFLGNWQKKMILKKMDEVMKQAEEVNIKEVKQNGNARF